MKDLLIAVIFAILGFLLCFMCIGAPGSEQKIHTRILGIELSRRHFPGDTPSHDAVFMELMVKSSKLSSDSVINYLIRMAKRTSRHGQTAIELLEEYYDMDDYVKYAEEIQAIADNQHISPGPEVKFLLSSNDAVINLSDSLDPLIWYGKSSNIRQYCENKGIRFIANVNVIRRILIRDDRDHLLYMLLNNNREYKGLIERVVNSPYEDIRLEIEDVLEFM